ncbi:MAG: NADH-quinone oxidoreductase subunit J, partial [Candidatus Pacebacteria bacterium]|nr:NADH-quinone oxidoreductase subunit J [Candidatus Paceibacterota bacterium]
MFFNIAFAQGTLEGNVANFMDRAFTVLVQPFLGLMFAVALVLFLYGVMIFIANTDKSSEDSNNGKKHMLWGIVGMFIMISVFGIMRLILNTFNIRSGGSPEQVTEVNSSTPTPPSGQGSSPVSYNPPPGSDDDYVVFGSALWENYAESSPINYLVEEEVCSNPNQSTGFLELFWFKKAFAQTDGTIYTTNPEDARLIEYQERLYLHNLTKGENYAAAFNKIRNKIVEEMYPENGPQSIIYVSESGTGPYGSDIDYWTSLEQDSINFILDDTFRSFYKEEGMVSIQNADTITTRLLRKYKPQEYRIIKHRYKEIVGPAFRVNGTTHFYTNDATPTSLEDEVDRVALKAIYPQLTDAIINQEIALMRQSPQFIKKGDSRVSQTLVSNSTEGIIQSSIVGRSDLAEDSYPFYPEPTCVVVHQPFDGYRRAPAPGFPNVNIL